MSYILSTKHARKSDSAFVVAAARAFYCDWFIQRAEENPALFKRYYGSGAGVELTEHTPETARWAFAVARKFVEQIENGHRRPLDSLIADWQAEGEAYAYRDRELTEENLGWYAAMQAMGHRVGLSNLGIETRLPYVEAYPH